MDAAREVSQNHSLDLIVQCLKLSGPDTVLFPHPKQKALDIPHLHLGVV
jgi:hypothetical protein